jgi:hypothetical protein
MRAARFFGRSHHLRSYCTLPARLKVGAELAVVLDPSTRSRSSSSTVALRLWSMLQSRSTNQTKPNMLRPLATPISHFQNLPLE